MCDQERKTNVRESLVVYYSIALLVQIKRGQSLVIFHSGDEVTFATANRFKYINTFYHLK